MKGWSSNRREMQIVLVCSNAQTRVDRDGGLASDKLLLLEGY
jgi:hypothetical protein